MAYEGTGTATNVLTTGGNGQTAHWAAASSGSNTIITKFTANGTWTKNANTKLVSVIIVCGGSGGGSGRRGATGAAGGGGGGPGGSPTFVCNYPQEFFNATETVTIGAGSLGAAGQTVDNTNGTNSAVQGVSQFGKLAISYTDVTGAATFAGYGPAGINGTSAQGASAVGIGTPFGGRTGGYSGSTSTGFDYTTYSSPKDPISAYSFGGPRGGGGGGGANSTTVRNGGVGAPVLNPIDGSVIIAGGTAGSESTTINGGDGGNSTYGAYSCLLIGGGGGGGGGGQKSGVVAGNGGNGGIPGGGGGGGGGSLNGTTSGAGGNGARGEVWVIETT